MRLCLLGHAGSVWQLPPPPWPAATQCGVNLPLWNSDVNMTQLNQSLEEFKADGGRDVSVNVVWFQDNINSTVIQPNYNLYTPTTPR